MHCLRDVLPVEIIVQVLQQLDVDSILNVVETGLLGHYEEVEEEDDDDGDVIDVYISGRIGVIGWVDRKGIVHQEHSCVKPKFATTLKLYSKDRYKGRRRRRDRELCYDVCTVSLLSLLRYVHLEHSDGTVLCLLLTSLPSSVQVLEVFITGALKGMAPDTNTFTKTLTTPALKMFTIVNINVWNQRRVATAVGWSARKVRHCIAEAQQHGGAGTVAEEAMVAQLSRTNPPIPPLVSSPVSVFALVRVQLQRMLLQCAATVHNVGVFGFDISWITPSAGIEPASPSFRELRLVRVGGDSMARLYTWLPLLIPSGSPKRDFSIPIGPTGPIGLKKLSPVVVVGGGLLGNSNNICKVVAADGRCVLVGGTGHDLLMRYTYTT